VPIEAQCASCADAFLLLLGLGKSGLSSCSAFLIAKETAEAQGKASRRRLYPAGCEICEELDSHKSELSTMQHAGSMIKLSLFGINVPKHSLKTMQMLEQMSPRHSIKVILEAFVLEDAPEPFAFG